jgi:hypothetical protein
VNRDEEAVLWCWVALCGLLLLWMLPGCIHTGNAQEGARIIRHWVGLR